MVLDLLCALFCFQMAATAIPVAVVRKPSVGDIAVVPRFPLCESKAVPKRSDNRRAVLILKFAGETGTTYMSYPDRSQVIPIHPPLLTLLPLLPSSNPPPPPQSHLFTTLGVCRLHPVCSC
jgi:hypothetical protein